MFHYVSPICGDMWWAKGFNQKTGSMNFLQLRAAWKPKFSGITIPFWGPVRQSARRSGRRPSSAPMCAVSVASGAGGAPKWANGLGNSRKHACRFSFQKGVPHATCLKQFLRGGRSVVNSVPAFWFCRCCCCAGAGATSHARDDNISQGWHHVSAGVTPGHAKDDIMSCSDRHHVMQGVRSRHASDMMSSLALL